MSQEQKDVVHLALNRAALDRLLGDDTELHVRLREQVVEEFAKKRLKCLLSEPLINKAAAEWAATVNAEFSEAVGRYGWCNGRWAAEATQQVRTFLEAAVKELLPKVVDRQAVDEVFQKALAEYQKQAELRLARFEQSMTATVVKTFNDALRKLEARMGEAFERRVQNGINFRLAAAASIEHLADADRPTPGDE